jgi:hypothetical protein
MNLAALSLVILPITFAYAVLRHRLLDVEIVIERGLAYTLATGSLVGAYLGLAALAGDYFRTHFPGAGTAGLVLAVIATGLLFQPLQRAIQARFERHFLRKRYDYRSALLAFGRELSSTTDLDRMIASLLEQLTERLQVSRAAVFVAQDADGRRFELRGAAGLYVEEGRDFGFLGSFGSFGSLGRILLPWFRAPSILLLAGLPRRGCPARRQASWAPEALRERRGSHEGTPRGKLCLTTPLAFLDPRRHCPIQSNRGALPTASGKFGPTGRTHRKAMAFSLFVYPVRARLQPCRTSRTKLGLQPLRFVFHSRGGVHHL